MTHRSGIQQPLAPQRVALEQDGHTLDVEIYPACNNNRPTPAVLVLPGGGFREHTRHDGEGYARWLARLGITAVVLRYQLAPDPFPLALQQARVTFAALRDGHLFPSIDAAKVGVIGSSAGGLLAGLLATNARLSIEPQSRHSVRPAFHIQSYGLADLGLLPDAAVAALLGTEQHLAAELSPVTHVDDKTSPSFIWATAQDPPGFSNAVAWARVLTRHDVPTELHVYPEGHHGIGLADGVAYGPHGHQRIDHTAQWTTACEKWLTHLEIIHGDPTGP